MKKLFTITAILLATSSLTYASTGSADYYDNNKAEWTLTAGSLGNVMYAWNDYITGFHAEKVACNNTRNMCYTSSTAKRAFGFDLNKFESGSIIATAEKPTWMYLNDLLK